MNKLDFNTKHPTSYCIDLWRRDEHIKLAIKKVKGRIQPSDITDEPVAIVGYAPSLNDTWEQVKNFQHIITCSGSHKFLLEKGLKPSMFKSWRHIEVDPREHKIQLLGEPVQGVEYMPASTCHPKYFDHLINNKANIKLWHVFANEQDSLRTLPAGEWSLTGGSDVGMRAMVIARFLGFTNLHIFGIDGSEGKTGKHAGKHPNQPKQAFETEYNGKMFLTTPALLECAKMVFHELDQLVDVKTTFYGEGLVQEMAKNHVMKPNKQAFIAYNKPELISDEYKKLNAQLHEENVGYGVGGGKHAETVLKLYKSISAESILDYGAGKGYLAKALPMPIWQYDPAIPDISESPKPADLVVSTDVLEHIEPDKIQFVLGDLQRCVKKIGYFVISTRPAVKTYANGVNTHLLLKDKAWWEKKLSKFFDIGTIMEKNNELHIIVAPKSTAPTAEEKITSIDFNGEVIKFHTPNETTEWRAKTLFTKEPSTIEWINSMEKGNVLFDVGANVGGYSLLAAKKGVNVFAFEPEAENYNILVKNMILNNIEPRAYCVALTDKRKAGQLFTNSSGPGGSCYSFDQPSNYSKGEIKQGCISMSLDDIVNMGLPAPHYLKIDVDGLEPLVIKGADYILKNGITSMLVEVNPSSHSHKEMLTKLAELGFSYNQEQVDRATRKEGTFKGVAEYIFTKQVSQPIEDHIVRRIQEAKLNKKPYEYLYIEDIFPEDVYKDIIENMPTNYEEIEKTRGTKGYPKRFTATPTDAFWSNINKQILSGKVKQAICDKFRVNNLDLNQDLLLIRDNPGYAIPPHTDSLSKVVSALFYLPADESLVNEGTSIFVPKKRGFICKEGRHHAFKDFKKVYTAPFKPNSLFLFKRTDNSFHGVEPCEHIRNVLLYNIKTK